MSSRIVRAFDLWQQRNRPVGFALATLQKYSDDQGSSLAATISYYAFFSLFPLLLVLTTVLGFVLTGHGDLERSLVDSALGQFPVIGRQLHAHSLREAASRSRSGSPLRSGPA